MMFVILALYPTSTDGYKENMTLQHHNIHWSTTIMVVSQIARCLHLKEKTINGTAATIQTAAKSKNNKCNFLKQ